MKATQSLPANYRLAGTFDITRNFRLVVWLNLLGLALLGLSALFFGQALLWLRPDDAKAGLALSLSSFGQVFETTLAFLLIYAAMIILHEAAHGVFFWLYTGARPHFAFKIYYAYAAAPGWYIPRHQYFVTALAPLVGLSLVCLLVFVFGPPAWFAPALMLAILNASGAVGDLWVAAWLLRLPATCLAEDKGDAVTLYIA